MISIFPLEPNNPAFHFKQTPTAVQADVFVRLKVSQMAGILWYHDHSVEIVGDE